MANFLDLPVELRCTTYGFLLTFRAYIVKSESRLVESRRALFALLLVNKQISAEVSYFVSSKPIENACQANEADIAKEVLSRVEAIHLGDHPIVRKPLAIRFAMEEQYVGVKRIPALSDMPHLTKITFHVSWWKQPPIHCMDRKPVEKY